MRNLRRLGAFAIIWLCAFIFWGCQGAPARLINVRDLGAINMIPGEVHLAVSLNDDDDDRDGREDLTTAPTASEDNLRELKFTAPGAAKVRVAEPVIQKPPGFIGPLQSAVGSRIRAYESDKVTPFRFRDAYPTPLTVYFEGIKASDKIDEFIFEYSYFDATDAGVSSGYAQGMVSDLNIERTADNSEDRLRRNRKLLATGVMQASSTVSPRTPGTLAWAYDGAGTFATPDKANSRFTAGNVSTPALDSQNVRLRLTPAHAASSVIEASEPLNVTHPRFVVSPPPTRGTNPRASGAISTAGIINVDKARAASVSFFDLEIDYEMQDQFRAAITESARGGKNLQIKERVPLRSAVPAGAIDDLQAWLDRVQHRRNWTNHNDGRWTDHIRALDLPMSHLMRSNPNMRLLVGANANVITMNGANAHEWLTSIDGALEQRVTNNTYLTQVSSYTPPTNVGVEEIEFTTTYTIVANP
jgi:hypothetical protein